jgi:hypothetical protein
VFVSAVSFAAGLRLLAARLGFSFDASSFLVLRERLPVLGFLAIDPLRFMSSRRCAAR